MAPCGTSLLLENGGFVWSCKNDGNIIDDSKDAYGHAFVILGLCLAFKATGNEDFLEGALNAHKLIRTKFRDKHGGLVWKKTRDWHDKDKNRSQNPMMHTFEALLALADVLDSCNIADKWWKVATSNNILQDVREIVEFLFLHLKPFHPFHQFDKYISSLRLRYNLLTIRHDRIHPVYIHC